MKQTVNSSQKNVNRDQLSALLAEQHQVAQLLLDSINRVAESVAASGVAKEGCETLEALLEEKATILDSLDRGNEKLQTWLTANGYAENAVSEAIATQPNNSLLTGFWNDFQALIGECQIQNSANSTLVHGRLKHTRQTLQLLTGGVPDDAPAYAENGKHTSDNASRRWAKA